MIGRKILHYRIGEKLGQGGMGIVFKALDTKLNRAVAIKFLPEMVASSDSERKRFRNEAQAVAALNHSNISHIYAIEESDDEVFIVMEYIDGRELKELTTAGELIPLPEGLDYAIQIAGALNAAHMKNIIHRDIKSANIMITSDNRVRVMDFGLAKMQGVSQLTIQGTTLGTILYMSPEQSQGKDVDHRTDIWSFGILLFEIMSNDFPFKGYYDQAVIYSVLNESPPDICELNSQVPREISEIINTCLQKDPQQRFQDMQEIIQRLNEVKNSLEQPLPQAAGPAKATTGNKEFPAIIRIVWFVIPLTLIIALLFMFYEGSGSNSDALMVETIPGSQQIATAGLNEPSVLIRELLEIKNAADLLKRLDVYKKDMKIAVGKSDDFVSKEGCYVFIADKDRINTVFIYSDNGFTNMFTKEKIYNLNDTYRGQTAIWLRDYSQ